MMKTATYYQNDLAALHDTHYSEYSEAAAALLLQKLRGQDIFTGTVVDLGCGSGKLAKLMADAGYDTIGVDYSESLLKLAKTHSAKTSFVHASIWDYPLPKCVAVSAIGEVINYTFSGHNTDANIETQFEKTYQCLESGGIFLFDFIAPGILKGKRVDLKVMDNKGWTTIVNYKENQADGELTRDITVFREITPNTYRKSREIHRVRLLEPSFLKSRLEAVGFKPEALEGYGPTTFRHGHYAFLSKKPK